MILALLTVRKAVSAKAPAPVAFRLLNNLIFREEQKVHRFGEKPASVVCKAGKKRLLCLFVV